MPNILQSLKNIPTILPDSPKANHSRLAEEFVDNSVPQYMKNSLGNELHSKVIEVNKNINQKLIVVTHDKTLLCLRRNLKKLGKAEWMAPLSTVTTILVTLITSDFRNAIWLGPAEWKAMFVISGLLATGWLAYTARKALRTKGIDEVTRCILYELGGQMSR